MGYLPFFSARAGYFGVCRGNRWDTARAGPAHHVSACWDGTPPVWDNVNAMAMRAAVCNGRAEVRAGWDNHGPSMAARVVAEFGLFYKYVSSIFSASHFFRLAVCPVRAILVENS